MVCNCYEDQQNKTCFAQEEKFIVIPPILWEHNLQEAWQSAPIRSCFKELFTFCY